MNYNTIYKSPEIHLYTVEVEQGFAQSGEKETGFELPYYVDGVEF